MSEEDTKVADLFDKDIENFGNDLDKMIEHLNIVIATHNKQVEEIERLNNIIDELEDSIVGKINVLYQVRGQSNAIQELSILLRQLRELKGSDKE